MGSVAVPSAALRGRCAARLATHGTAARLAAASRGGASAPLRALRRRSVGRRSSVRRSVLGASLPAPVGRRRSAPARRRVSLLPSPFLPLPRVLGSARRRVSPLPSPFLPMPRVLAPRRVPCRVCHFLLHFVLKKINLHIFVVLSTTLRYRASVFFVSSPSDGARAFGSHSARSCAPQYSHSPRSVAAAFGSSPGRLSFIVVIYV